MRYLILLFPLWLAGCGQAGDLYLPEPEAPLRPQAGQVQEEERDQEGKP